MTYDDLIKHYGSPTEVAAVLATTAWPATKQAVGQWRHRVPDGRQHQFELLTHGLLKADKPSKKKSEAA